MAVSSTPGQVGQSETRERVGFADQEDPTRTDLRARFCMCHHDDLVSLSSIRHTTHTIMPYLIDGNVQ